MQVIIRFQGQVVADDKFVVRRQEEVRTITLHDFNDHGLGRWWSPEHPNLYDIEFTMLQNGTQADKVKSHFGMRKISVENGKLCLNNRPYFMKLVLDFDRSFG